MKEGASEKGLEEIIAKHKKAIRGSRKGGLKLQEIHGVNKERDKGAWP